jgi:ABC-type Na+ transport system ATPase subunit NatA
MNELGMDNVLIERVKSFLSGSKQRVKIGNLILSLEAVNVGVP